MAQMTPQVSEMLEKALTLSPQERGLLIDRLVDSLDEGPAEEGVEEAWAEEIKRRVDDIRSGKVEMIPGEEVRRRLCSSALEWRGVSLIASIPEHGRKLRLETTGTYSAALTPVSVLSLPSVTRLTAFPKRPRGGPSICTVLGVLCFTAFRFPSSTSMTATN